MSLLLPSPIVAEFFTTYNGSGLWCGVVVEKKETDGGGSTSEREEKKSIKIKYIAVYIASLPLRFFLSFFFEMRML